MKAPVLKLLGNLLTSQGNYIFLSRFTVYYAVSLLTHVCQ